MAGGLALWTVGASGPGLLAAARAEAGGALLDRVAALNWAGTARVATPSRVLDLTVETRVEPFRRARSRSWVTAAGEASARTLVVEPRAGWVERGGERSPLPPAQVAHERQQYGLYGYMLLDPVLTREVAGRLEARRDGLPPARFDLAPSGRLAAADYAVTAPDGRGIVEQRFAFSGLVRNRGVHWPARMEIAQDGRPYFTLDIAELEVELRSA